MDEDMEFLGIETTDLDEVLDLLAYPGASWDGLDNA